MRRDNSLVWLDIILWALVMLYFGGALFSSIGNFAAGPVPCRQLHETRISVLACYWNSNPSNNIVLPIFGMALYHWVRFLRRGGGSAISLGLVMPLFSTALAVWGVISVADDWRRIFKFVFDV